MNLVDENAILAHFRSPNYTLVQYVFCPYCMMIKVYESEHELSN